MTTTDPDLDAAEPAEPADAPRGLRARTVSALSPLRRRDYRLIWFSQVVSELGDWAGRLVLAALVYDRTGSAVWAALVYVSSLLPWIGPGQYLSTFADRHGRRITMLVSDLVRAGLFVLLVVPMPVYLLALLALLAGLATPPFEAARSSAVAEVSGDDLPRAAALASTTMNVATLLGYLAGGLLLAFVGTTPALLLNAGSFLVSAALVSRLPALHPLSPPEAVHDAWGMLKEAGRGMWEDRVVRSVVLLVTVVTGVTTGVEAQTVIFSQDVFPASSWVSGLLLSGGVVMTLLATPLAVREFAPHRKVSFLHLFVVVSASLSLLLLVGPRVVAATGFVAIGLMFAPMVGANVLVAPRLPGHRRATCFSLLMGGLALSQAVFTLLVGLLVGSLGAAHAAAAACAFVLVFALASWSWSARHRDEDVTGTAAAADEPATDEPDALPALESVS